MSSQSARTLINLSTGLSTGLSGYVIGRNQTKKEPTNYELNELNELNTSKKIQDEIQDDYIDISKVIMWRAID